MERPLPVEPRRARRPARPALRSPCAALTALPAVEQVCDVSCVTGWTVFDSVWTGVRVSELAKLVKVKNAARHVIFEAANGYTANVRYPEATLPNVLVAYRFHGAPLP